MLAGSPMGFIPFFQVKQMKSDPLICTHFTRFSRVCVTGALTTLTGPKAPSDLGTGPSEHIEAFRCPVRPSLSTHTPQTHGFTTNVSQYFNLMFRNRFCSYKYTPIAICLNQLLHSFTVILKHHFCISAWNTDS